MQELKDIVLPNYPLVLSLLKHRNVWVFWNKKKKSSSNRCSPLNNSIEENKPSGCDPQGNRTYSMWPKISLKLKDFPPKKKKKG